MFPGINLPREASTVRRRNLQCLERLLVAPRALEQERHELRMAEGAGYPDISLRAVDLPEEAVAVPRIRRDSEWRRVRRWSILRSPVLVRSGHRQRLPVSATSAVVRLVASTEDTSANLPSTSVSAASVLPTTEGREKCRSCAYDGLASSQMYLRCSPLGAPRACRPIPGETLPLFPPDQVW